MTHAQIDNRSLKNILRGITPTADATWTTPPTDLENITNGNTSTTSGVGQKSLSGAGIIGYITFDLGSVKSFTLNGLINAWASTGSGQIDMQVQISDDGINYSGTTGDKIGNTTSVTEDISSRLTFDNSPSLVTRYFRLRFYGSAAMTANIRLTEVYGYELGPVV